MEIVVAAARGMSYLEKKNIIHRDLAARNVLIGKKGQIKVSDFGMSRDILYQASATDKQIPIRWASPEMLNQQAVTSKSDVFSFGVMMWEIFSFGLTPYTDLSNKQVVTLVTEIQDNRELLERPHNCPPEVFNLMKRCWSYNPQQRPSFKEILQVLESKNGENGSLQPRGPQTYTNVPKKNEPEATRKYSSPNMMMPQPYMAPPNRQYSSPNFGNSAPQYPPPNSQPEISRKYSSPKLEAQYNSPNKDAELTRKYSSPRVTDSNRKYTTPRIESNGPPQQAPPPTPGDLSRTYSGMPKAAERPPSVVTKKDSYAIWDKK
jgi:serine/threonine protein kinase